MKDLAPADPCRTAAAQLLTASAAMLDVADRIRDLANELAAQSDALRH